MASSDKNENYFRQGLPYMFALHFCGSFKISKCVTWSKSLKLLVFMVILFSIFFNLNRYL